MTPTFRVPFIYFAYALLFLSTGRVLDGASNLCADPPAITFRYPGIPASPTCGNCSGMHLVECGTHNYVVMNSAAGDHLEVTSGNSWLFVRGVLVLYALTPEIVQPGTYYGTVIVYASNYANSPLTIPVTFISGKSKVIAEPSTLSFVHRVGSPPPLEQIVSFTSTIEPVGVSVTVASSASNWVSVYDWLFGKSAATSLTTPNTLRVMVDPTNLAPGVYNTEIKLQIGLQAAQYADCPTSIPVRLTVISPYVLSPLPTSLTFNYQQGNPLPPTQILALSGGSGSAGAGFSLNVSTQSGGPWLTVNRTVGSFPASVDIGVNPTGLSPGSYRGSLTVSSEGATNSPLQVPVTLTVSPKSQLTVSPSSLAFAYQIGGALPAAETVAVGSSGASLSLSATASSAGNWLSAATSSTTTPATMTISVNPAGLVPGAYNGNVTINSTGTANSPQVVPVTLTVSAAPALSVAPLSLSFTHTLGQPPPLTLDISVTSPSTVAFTARTEGASWLAVTPTSGNAPATLKVSVTPTGLPQGTHNGRVLISIPGSTSGPYTVGISLAVVGSATVAAVVNGATFVAGPLSPGEILAVFGAGLGLTTLVTSKLDSAGRFPSELDGCRIFVDGIPAPLIYTSGTQVGAVVPYAIAGRISVKVQLEYKSVRSNTIEFQVVDASPGLFTLDATGGGQGAILNQDYSVNSETNPADKDSVVMMYATGEGQTDPRGVDGKAASVPLPAPLLPVAVRIGGVDAEVLYAGAAPGLVAGVMQVNVRVPASALSGKAVPVQLIVGGIKSPSGVTVSIR